MANPNIVEAGKNTQFKEGQSGNPAGRPVGSKNLATIIGELEAEDFDWSKVPIKQREAAQAIGSPWRAIVYTAIAKAYSGDMRAAEWLRKSGYGDKLDVTSGGKRISQPPVIVSEIKKRNVSTETETTESS